MIGNKIHNLAKKLWPINRSITGQGNRETLKVLKEVCPNIKIKEIKSGTKVFDWIIPQEWEVKDAWIKAPNGKKVVDFKDNNLHIIGYSTSVNKVMSLNQLKKNLYSLPDLPNAIPYVTSYYSKRWGFCLTENLKKKLKKGSYKVYINSKHFPGSLTYGELVLPGKSKKEILISTYICHPSMANNELSGPCVAIYVAQWLKKLRKLHYSYRFVFVPETIGSIAYLSRNLKHLKKNVIAGYNLTCVGDNRAYSYLPSRNGKTLSDRVLKHVLKWTDKNFKEYSWLDRGSDERQYCAPGVDLPIASIIRSKYECYKEYHTSLDNLDRVVRPIGLASSFKLIQRVLEAIERNHFPRSTNFCEPMLSKRNLYPTIKLKNKRDVNTKLMMDITSFCDGKTDLLSIADKCNISIWKLYDFINVLKENKVIKF